MNPKSAGQDGLRIGVVVHPASPHNTVQFFSDWQSACNHLRDHLLTEPECFAWLLVDPGYDQILDAGNPDARWAYADRALSSGGRTAQAFYDLYCAAVSRDLQDAALLGWHRTTGRATVSLGTSGILTVIEQAVKTAFLPGQGITEATKASKGRGQGGGLPRERGMRSGRPGWRDNRSSDRDRQIRQQREAQWSRSERLYYRVFRPAVQHLRRSHHHSRDMFGNLAQSDYALLKDVLPHLSHLKYENWTDLRQRCNRNG